MTISHKTIAKIIVLLCTVSGTFGYIAEGRHSGAFQSPNQLSNFPHSQTQSNDNQLEYGGLPGEDDDVGAIEQISRDEDVEDFSSLIQQNALDGAPPKYTQATVESPEAATPKGTFIGFKQTINGTDVYAFYGIPFAKPPTGDLRFRRPQPAEVVESFDATHLPNSCPQTVPDVFNDFPGEKMWVPNNNISEDCLYLNIWVPVSVFNQKESKLAPVLFWIFGGGYFSGSNALEVYNGAKLAASQGIVVVSVQYRLGPLGFLYIEPEQANLGLLDQSLGLQWTNQNIEYFGGDPNSLTAAGESCGAASVVYHLVSPLSKSYIKRGIITSGLPTQRYSINSVETMKERSIQLAKYAGCDQKSAHDIVECLRKVDSDKLVSLQWKLFKNMLEFPFTPVIDGYFLQDHPEVLISKGKAKRADLIMGTVGDEGSFFVVYHYINYFSHLKPTSVPYDRFVDIMNELFYDYSETEREAIIDEYTNWENPEDGYVNQQKISEAVGDAFFVCPHRKFADNWANRGLGVYYYHISERLSVNPWAKWMGVMHGDDIAFLFGTLPSVTPTPKEENLIRNFQDMIGKFVKQGVPSYKWERYTSEHPVFLDVNATVISKASSPKHGPNSKTCAFWNKLLPSLRNTEECCKMFKPNYHNAFPPTHTHGQCNHGGPSFQSQNLHLPQSHFAPHQPQTFCSAPHYSSPSSMFCSPTPQCQMAQSPASTEQPSATSTSTSCRCTVEEGSSDGLATPPPARF